jgi:hypothetical protein
MSAPKSSITTGAVAAKQLAGCIAKFDPQDQTR